MYIIYPIEKDTYITNKYLSTGIDGKNANFGKASTLDLYKTYNENIYLKSNCLLKLHQKPIQNEVISFKNILNVDINLLIDISKDSQDQLNGELQNNQYIIGISDLNTIEDIVNHIKLIVNELEINVKIYVHKSGLILIEQQKTGEIGDKVLTLSQNSSFEIIRNFSRVEESALLLKSDLLKDNEYFSYRIVEGYIKIYLELHDITTSLSKPLDYTIEVLPLTKDFNEGLGRDVYSLTDVDTANWIYCNYNGNTNEPVGWETLGEIGLIEGTVSNECDILTEYDGYDFKDEKKCEFYFKKGDENAYIDITAIYEKFWQSQNPLIDKGLVVKFSNQNLYDDETYFAKRFGSKNVRNGHLKPCFKILIDDAAYNIPIKNNFYFNEENKIFLYNKKGNRLQNIQKISNGLIVDIDPTVDLTLNITSIDKINNIPIVSISDISCIQASDIRGEVLKGIYNANWQINSLGNNNLLNLLLQREALDFKFEWVNQDGILIYSEIRKIYKDTITTINTFRRLRASVKLYSPDLGVLNEIHKIAVTFFDLDAQYDFVKVKKTLEGLDVGDVFYEVIDYDTNEVLIPATEDMNATKCIKENDYYWFPFFNSDIFYGRRIQFIFKLKQQEQNNLIVSTSEVFRVGNNG